MVPFITFFWIWFQIFKEEKIVTYGSTFYMQLPDFDLDVLFIM